jgi:endonuclease-8
MIVRHRRLHDGNAHADELREARPPHGSTVASLHARRRLAPSSRATAERARGSAPPRRDAAPARRGEGIAERLDGLRLESVEAHGKNLLLQFEGGLVLRSHLRMTGRWRVTEVGRSRTGTPWLVLRGDEYEGVLWNGPVLELERARTLRRALGPDILAEPPDLDGMLRRLRRSDQSGSVGDALLDQKLVAGIGNLWKAECLWDARLSPWRRLADTTDDELRAALTSAHESMSRSVRGGRRLRRAYRRTGRACSRCGTPIRSAPQGDDARTAYWCPACQPGGDGPGRA